MTYDGINIGEAVQPIQDRVETFQSNGYAVVSPGDALSAGAYAVTVNSGNLDASDTLSVGSSNDEIIFDGSTKSLSSATNVRINSVSAAGDGTEQYRYDVIYGDSSGEVQKTEGSVTKLDSRESQNNLTRFERFKGAIPNPGTDPSVIIAAVIVNSNDTSVGTSQLRDYRVSATHKVNTLEADNASIGTVQNLEADNASIGTVQNEGDVFRLIDKREPSSDKGQIQFSNLSSNKIYRIFITAGMGVSNSPSSWRLRLNGDGSSTSNYEYWDASGTKQSGEDEFLIGEFSSNTRCATQITVTAADTATESRQGINQDFLPLRSPRVNNFAREGGRDIGETLTSIELIADEDFSGNDTVVELWERDF